MYIHREIEKELILFLKRREILAIVGPRQVGKTTLLQYLFSKLKKNKKIEFLTFEKKSDLSLFENIEDFKEYYKDYQVLIIDEFQYAKDGGQKLKYLFDTTKIKFIISGSSSLELTFETGKYLVGRIFNFSLHPFSFREFLSYKDKRLFTLLEFRFKDIFTPLESSTSWGEDKKRAGAKTPSFLTGFIEKFNNKRIFGKEINSRLEKYFEEYLVFGGYPAQVLAKTQNEKIKILESILENYLLKDIKALLHLKTHRELLRVAEFLATQIAELLNYKELSNSSNLSYKNVLNYLDILENTFIVSLSKPFFTNPRTELTKMPKVYFVDTGFRNYLLSNFKKFSKRDDKGRLVENFVFCELKRKNLGKINFWRTKSKAEVDFVFKKEDEIVPIEVKYSSSVSIGKSFYSFIEKFSPKQGYIFTQGFFDIKKIKKTKIYFIPVYYL